MRRFVRISQGTVGRFPVVSCGGSWRTALSKRERTEATSSLQRAEVAFLQLRSVGRCSYGRSEGTPSCKRQRTKFSRRKLPFVVVLNLLSFSYAVPRCACAIGHVNASQVLLCRMTSFLTFGLVVLVEVVSSGLKRFVQSQVRRPR